MPEWLRAIGEATPAITQMQSAVQDMDLQAMKMREAQAEIDILDKPKPLVDVMTKFEGAPETANAFLKIAEPFIKTDPSGVKYLTERVHRHIRKQVLDDDSMLDMVQKARGRDAENQVFAAHAALQKAREKGKPEDIQAAMENYKKTVDAMSIFTTANIEFDRKRREAMAKDTADIERAKIAAGYRPAPQGGYTPPPNEWVDVDLPGGGRVTAKGHQVLDAYTKGGKGESEYKTGAIVDDTAKYYKGQKDALKTTYGSINPVTGQFAVDRDKVKEYQAELNRVQRMEDEDFYFISRGMKPKWLTGHFLREQQQQAQDDAIKSLIQDYSAGY